MTRDVLWASLSPFSPFWAFEPHDFVLLPCLCVLWSFFFFCLDRLGVLVLGGVFLSRSGFSLSSHP